MKIAFSIYHAKNVEAVRKLDPAVRKLFFEFLRRIGIAGIPIRVTSGRRTKEEQDAEYAKGRTKPGPIVTDAKGDGSYHVWGLAIDIAPLMEIGPAKFKTWYAKLAYDQLDSIAKELGIEHPIQQDLPHFQYTAGLKISDLRKGKKVPKAQFSALPCESKILARAMARHPL